MRKSSFRERFRHSEFRRCFNFQDDLATGRSMLLVHNGLINMVNVIITGVFYTGFLASSGIDIINVGIIAFVPYIAWTFGLLSPKLLSRFKKRRALLVANHVFYYACVVFATTIMPAFVEDKGTRTILFAVFVLIGNISNALIGSGATAWHVRFLQDGNTRRYYMSMQYLVIGIANALTALISSSVADSLSNSPAQGQIIATMRFIACGVAIVSGLLLFLRPKEYPYEQTAGNVRLRDVFVLPFREKKFLLTVLIVFMWSFVCNVNAQTWSYYLLNTVGVSYTYTYINTIAYAVFTICFLGFWRRIISHNSVFHLVMVGFLTAAGFEFLISFTTSYTIWLYVLASIGQAFNSVMLNIVYAELFYVNLPPTNRDVHTVFYNFAANISTLLGQVFGTGFLAVIGESERTLFGLPFYGSQFLIWFKGATILLLCVYIIKMRPRVEQDDESDPGPRPPSPRWHRIDWRHMHLRRL